MDTILAAVDFDGVEAWVLVAGVAVVGIALAFKAITLAKRGINKA